MFCRKKCENVVLNALFLRPTILYSLISTIGAQCAAADRSAADFGLHVETAVVPCVLALAGRVTGEQAWKPLHRAVLMLTRRCEIRWNLFLFLDLFFSLAFFHMFVTRV